MRSVQRVLRTGTLVAFIALLAAQCGAAPPDAGVVKTSEPAEATTRPVETAEPAPKVEPTAVSTETSTLSVEWAVDCAPEFADPHRTTCGTWVHTWKNVAEPLLDVLPGSSELQPLLAESWELQENGRIVILHLRPGVTFHDGTEFNADAVKFNLERLTALQAGPAYVLATVDRIEIVDPLTVRIVQTRPFTPLLAGLALIGMISPTSIMENEVNGDQGVEYTNRNLIGAGPYRLRELEFNERVVLERFDDYWQGWDGRHVDRVLVDIGTTEAAAQLLKLEAGELDIAFQVPLDSVPRLESDSRYIVLKNPSSTNWIVRMNLQGGPTADVRVRKAFNYLWNFEAFSTLVQGLTSVSDGPIAGGLISPEEPTNPYSYDPDTAKQLLEEAGVSPERTTVNWYFAQGNVEARLIAEVMQIELQNVGFDVVVNEMPFFPMVETFLNWYQNPDPDDVPTAFSIFVNPRFADPYSVAFLFYACEMAGSTAGRNINHYCNEEVDGLISEAASSTDLGRSKELYAEAARIIAEDDVPDIFIAKRVETRFALCNVKGFKLNPVYFEYINFYQIYKDDAC